MRTLTNIAVSIVIALGLVFVVRALAGFIFAPERPAKPAIEVPVTEEQAAKEEQAGEAQKAAEKPAPKEEKTAAAEKPAEQPAQTEAPAAAEQPAEQPATTGQTMAAAPAGGDAAAGKKVFNKCKACHFVDREKNKVGPYLKGVVGRKAAAVEGFKYSDSMKAKAAEGLTWTEENLAAYLKAPKKFIPGNKMAFAGLKKDEDVANVIAYLKSMAQ